ncbi:biotin-dependent carboxyltransferase family protein [Arthrobacter sp. AK01]|uniref:biotin-dependent carboxyltransferase family protein n=1 Tax=Micrococcaceae TaxID=1268 RepID=UPI001E4BE254|nr:MULTISPECIES: biotin-dependent carboxyltransferase family protein [Micrococcaceae]MCD4851479.1 biotin-dependent carboxyltransferase family protein [Arthrobacter sp. AK01]MCP1412042.1 allophanate hydrolase subunit 2 [Paenarthrobacter sp. A20]
MSAVVTDPGTLTLAVEPDHALDRASMYLANTLLGNPDTSAGLEVLLGGLKLRFVTGSAVAVTGAEGMVTLNGSELPLNKAVRVAPGAVLEFGPALFGIRYYVAVQGGVEAGTAPLRAGASVTFGRPHGHGFPELNHPARRALDPERPVVARVTRGPQARNDDAGSWLRLTSEPWILSPESDRAGARLAGRPLEVAPREGGATQVPQPQPLEAGLVLLPPSGLPVIALAGHPPTAGSPVIAVVRDEDLDLIGQARPGQMVHLLG